MQTLKEEIRERILIAAEGLFYEKGFRDTTTRAIASAVGISVSNLYLYFENKEIILFALIDEFCSRVTGGMRRFLDHRDETGKDAEISAIFKTILTREHRKFVIAAERSQGTAYSAFKATLISMAQEHITRQIKDEFSRDPVIPLIIAKNFIEGILEIAKSFEDRDEDALDGRLRFFATFHMSGMAPFL